MALIRYSSTQKTVQDFVNLYSKGQLDLKPGFQRESVWHERDRARLVDSILKGYPLPAIFLYESPENGEIVYRVIDGKQRLESILMFMGAIKGRGFSARVDLPDSTGPETIDGKLLWKRNLGHLFTGYKLQVIEVEGELASIIELFVRINSLGKPLTAAERRHARYYRSNLLKSAAKLAKRYERYLSEAKVMSSSQMARMKHVELITEIMISIHQGAVINKKSAVDRVMDADTMKPAEIEKARLATISALNRVKRMFPDLVSTRFHQIADFYSLVVLIAKFEKAKLGLADKSRNLLAEDLLKAFSVGVDTVRDLQKNAKAATEEYALHRDYLMTALQATDLQAQRQLREDILRGLLESLFEKKDAKRSFSKEQRRIIWNTAENRCCAKCGKELTWDDFTVDHIKPYSKGGRTALDNAAILCQQHNSAKGNH